MWAAAALTLGVAALAVYSTSQQQSSVLTDSEVSVEKKEVCWCPCASSCEGALHTLSFVATMKLVMLGAGTLVLLTLDSRCRSNMMGCGNAERVRT